MSITDQPDRDPAEDPTSEVPSDADKTSLPNLSALRWPTVQALREMGGAASDDEIAEHVADSLNLTQQQRTVMIPSGRETKLRNRIGWAVHELKEIDAVHYPRPGHRALTPLGLEVDEEQVKILRTAFETSKSSSSVEQQEGHEQTDTPAAWLIRAGRNAEFYDYNVENGLVSVGFGDLPDLSEVSSRDEMAELVSGESPTDSEAKVRARAGQLWALRSRVCCGDLVVMPGKIGSHFALGTVTRQYWYRHDSDNMQHHAVSVDWKRIDVPRTAVRQDLLKSLSHRRTIVSIKGNDEAWRLHQLLETGRDPGAQVGDASASPEESHLSTLIEQFRIETGYPTADHEEQKRLREEWADKLASKNIVSLSRNDLTAITNHAVDYGEYVRQVEGPMKWINDLDDAEYTRLLNNINDLCWGPYELSVRIDRLVDWGGSNRETGTKGFADGNMSATLAICHPDRFLPTHAQGGKRGRAPMLRRLDLPDTQGSTFGQHVVDANDRLREHLAPYLGDDTQAMGAFLYWLLDQDIDAGPSSEPDLDGLARELLVDTQFLTDIVELLKDKRQVILYGPPGTGKTYLARGLAKTLAPDESCRALVQFHPSTSYEDFFEGYRPAGTDDGGGIHHELTPGPLARMAERAFEAPDRQHVMIIDEINRGNLPRVLGELLFLLEYRDESVSTLYRPEKPFSLPENLWFIGTMNTADRSIALVDAALRRRFHFVPFFPDRGPMAGLLSRWLEAENEPDWIGRLVDAVNDELKAELEGSHLLLGPSHFMKEYGSSPTEQHERLRRIWEYNIEPFIEDQFFGDPVQIERFRFKAVMARYGPTPPREAAPSQSW